MSHLDAYSPGSRDRASPTEREMPLNETTLDGAVVFTTRRLTCRRWRRDDLPHVFAIYSDPEGARWVGNGTPITRADSERWMEVTASNYVERGYGMFAVESRETDSIVGFCGLVHPGGQTDAEIKYAYRRVDWGKGYASEIAPALIRYGDERFHLPRIIATVARENFASQRVLEKAGMSFIEAIEDEDGETLVFDWRA